MRAAFLLHGYATDVDDFKSLLPFLNKNYDAVFIDDLPGHGKDGDPNCFTVNTTFDYVDGKYNEISAKYENIDVYGFSMGGALATYLASNKKIDNLILLAPANAYLNIKAFFLRAKKEVEYLFKENNEKGEVRKEVRRINSKRSSDMMLRKLLPNYSITTMITFARIVRKCNNSLKENETRTLIIWGDLDQLVPRRAIDTIRKYFINTKLEVIPDMSHLMLYSRNYRDIIRRIDTFLQT